MRLRLIIAGAVVGLALVGGGVYALRMADQAGVGAAAMAKIVCSCVFVDGRPPESCRADDPPGFEDVPVTVDRQSKSATGTLFMVVTRRATYAEGTGCTLDP
jgi:hypothetical protein